MWNILRNGNQIESSSPFSESSDLGCTQGEAEVDHEAIRAKANHFRRMTTTIVLNCLYVAGTGRPDLLWFGRSTWRHVENSCQKVNTIDSLYQPIETLQSILLCWRQDGGLQIWFVSGRIFGGRCTRFKGGGNTNRFSTSWIYKKQTAVPHSSCVLETFFSPIQRFQTKGRSQCVHVFPSRSELWSLHDEKDHARQMQKHTPLTRIEGMPPPTSLGELITADHKILNLDDESKQDHRNALIVQDGARIAYSGILRKQRRTSNCFHSRSQEGSSQTVQWNSSKHVRTCDGRMTRIS